METRLVFVVKQPMLVIMEKSFFGKLFSRPTKIAPVVAPALVDLENAEVQFGLGLKFASSAGAAQDYVQAASWYRKAAEQNHGLAQFNLGTMYANGQGVTKDDAQSLIWFGRAANLGDAGGQYKMARSCQHASQNGLPADAPEARIEAYKWFQLSAAQGYQKSEGAYAPLTFKMTRADVAEAIARVTKFSAVKESTPLSE